MAQEKRDNKLIYTEDVAQAKLLEGAKVAWDAVSQTYGPRGKNLLIEKTYGRPILTRDGITVSKEVYFSDRPKNLGAQLVTEASQNTNRKAGDGTSASAGLTYYLLEGSAKAVAAGAHPMTVRETLQKDAATLLAKIDELSTPVTEGQLKQVARVSSGEEALGDMIADAVEYVGLDGGIIAEKAYVDGVEREYVNGYYMQEGFGALSEGKREIEQPIVVVSSKSISSSADFVELIEAVVRLTQEQKPRIAFIGEFSGQAEQNIVANIIKGSIDAVIVKTPAAGEMGNKYLEDIALYCGAKVIAAGSSLKDIDGSNIGRADKVIATPYATTILGGHNSDEDLASRVAELESRIDAEESPHLIEKLRDRIAKLQGKVAIFRIGGATDTEKEEKEFRIEDAVQATRAALEHGTVAGGGVTLLHLSQTEGLSTIFKEALQNLFKRLLDNAALPSEVKMHEVLRSEYPMGFNLRGTDELLNIIEAGVLDPTLVVKETITNAASIAGNMRTVGMVITFEDKEDGATK